MSRYLLFFGCVLLGVLPCKSQDVIVLHKENKLTGRVLWEKSKGDSLFYRSAVSSGDSLLLFVPRRRVEYVLSDGDRRMLYRGKTRGWQPWRGRTFNEVPQHRMLYGVSGGIITDGWSAEASAMRYLNRSNFFGIGGFVRYAETNPFRKDVGMKNTTLGYSYDNRAVSLGGQAEFRGYLRRLKTYGYLQLGVGCSYHRFSGWQYAWREDVHFGSHDDDFWEEYNEHFWEDYPESKIAFTFHCKAGVYVCLTRGLYADVAVGCTGRFIDHTMSEVASVFKTSDIYPFGISFGLRFGRERR